MTEFPYSIKFIFNILHFLGFMSSYEFKKKWKNQLMQIYRFTFHLVIIVVFASHLLCTTTRSIRYLPEFYQRLLEDMGYNWFYVECSFLKFNRASFEKMMKFMSTNFSTADKVISAASHARAVFFFRFVGLLIGLSLAASFIETYFPVSHEETERLRYIYKRSHPERRLPTNFWIPYLDDSESWTYEILFYLEFYLITVVLILGTIACTLLPMQICYLLGQYDILCKHVEMLGRTHRDQAGDTIYYTNFETNAFIKLNPREKSRLQQQDYNQHYCHQLIRFHQKLLQFQTKLTKFYNPIMFMKIFINNFATALCLYQLSDKSITSISKPRQYKLVLEMMGIMFQYYFLCQCSEELNECHRRVNLAITRSHWFKCSPSTRRDLCMVLKRTQPPNHMKFYHGAIVLSRPYFLSVIKVSYSYVNFMRLSAR